MKRLLTMCGVLLVASGMLLADGPWSLFGGARVARQDGSNPWVINLTSNSDPSTTYSGLAFQQPNGQLLFSQIAQLSTDYDATTGGCGGGSPRFQITVDRGADVLSNVFVYIGDLPGFGCPFAASAWQSTGNLINSGQARFDTTQVGGTFYDTFENAVGLVGSERVVSVTLVVDSGWMFPSGEVILVDNVT